MNDYAWTFKQTERERKATGRGAFHKKGGSRSKKCSLPSDKLTAKQRKELNGKVEVYKLNEKKTWTEFLSMPEWCRKQYITNLIEQYGARRKDIAAMFGMSEGYLSKYMLEKMGGWKPWDGKASKHSPSQKWLEFLASNETLPGEVTLPSEDDNSPESESHEVKQQVLTEVSSERATVDLDIISGTLRYIGDPRAVFEKALLAMDTSKTYRITVMFDTDFVKEAE